MKSDFQKQLIKGADRGRSLTNARTFGSGSFNVFFDVFSALATQGQLHSSFDLLTAFGIFYCGFHVRSLSCCELFIAYSLMSTLSLLLCIPDSLIH